MVLDKLMFTIGGDDKPAHGSPKPAKKRASKKRKSGSDTPESSIRESTASTVQEHPIQEQDEHNSSLPLFEPQEHTKPTQHDAKPAITTSPALMQPRHPDVVEVASPIAHAQHLFGNTNPLTTPPTSTTERHYYRNPDTGIQREIWRPGDGDGLKGADYHGRAGPLPPIHLRWRFYQSTSHNSPLSPSSLPPRYVILDDRNAYEVYSSNIARAVIVRNWPHDFAAPGKVRARRVHRGRGAVVDAEAEEGDARYGKGVVASSTVPYVFKGEGGYRGMSYDGDGEMGRGMELVGVGKGVEDLGDAEDVEREEDMEMRKHLGHNQFTPRELLVKYGAPSMAKRVKKSWLRGGAFSMRDLSAGVGRKRGGPGERVPSAATQIAEHDVDTPRLEHGIPAGGRIDEKTREEVIAMLDAPGGDDDDSIDVPFGATDVDAKPHTHPDVRPSSNLTDVPPHSLNQDETYSFDKDLPFAQTPAQRTPAERRLKSTVAPHVTAEFYTEHLQNTLAAANARIEAQTRELQALRMAMAGQHADAEASASLNSPGLDAFPDDN